ncbi:MAG: ABC transporter permease [Tannerellaceae bacterium]|nr:ABC transporter permease [Tannerellaceae bacterium]
MKTLFINFLAVIRRFKLAAFLNVIGLSVSFAAFIVILMQVWHEYTFESCHPEAEQIYRVEAISPTGSRYIFTGGESERMITSSPYIEAGTYLNPFPGDFYFTVGDGPDKRGYTERIYSCFPDITDVFHFKLLEGEEKCLEMPKHILIPHSLAKKVFGDRPAVGKEMRVIQYIWTVEETTFFIVGGVYEDFPSNTQLENVVYAGVDEEIKKEWDSSVFLVYVKLNPYAVPEEVAGNYTDLYYKEEGGEDVLALMPLKDIYFQGNSQDSKVAKSGDQTITNVLILIACLVLGIATVNYVNFSTSLAPLRMKSMNTQKVLGSSDAALRGTLLTEAMATCFLSFLLSLGIIHGLSRAGSLSFMNINLSLSGYPSILLLTFILSIAIGGIAGLYPSYYMTSFSPALLLKGNHGLSPAGKKLRLFLISFQFIISFILIIGTLFIQEQNRFMRSYHPGFDTDQIAVVKIGNDMYLESRNTYVEQLKQHPGIADVAFAEAKFGATNIYGTWSELKYKDKVLGTERLVVSWNFPEVMGIKLLDGHPLTPMYDQTPVIYGIPNKKMYDEYEMELDTKIEFPWADNLSITIVGVTDDIHYTSLKYGVQNSCFLFMGGIKPYTYIRINADSDMGQVVDHIRKTVKAIDPAYPVEVEFFDTMYNDLYQREETVSKIIFLFSFLAVLISLIGVFALVIFESQYRFKEIAIRKVYGASVRGILWIFNSYYLKILFICFVIAIPFAWYGVNEWLKDFAYKTPLYWWVYAIAFLIIAFITLVTVTYQSWKAATVNPTDSLKGD